jgi:hypothetical protein
MFVVIGRCIKGVSDALLLSKSVERKKKSDQEAKEEELTEKK